MVVLWSHLPFEVTLAGANVREGRRREEDLRSPPPGSGASEEPENGGPAYIPLHTFVLLTVLSIY